MMEQTTPSLTFRKVIPDMLAGIAVFALIVGLSCGSTSVFASESSSMFGSHVSHRETVILLAGGLAAMVALNVAVFRHLIRAYVAPRRAAPPTRESTRRGGRVPPSIDIDVHHGLRKLREPLEVTAQIIFRAMLATGALANHDAVLHADRADLVAALPAADLRTTL